MSRRRSRSPARRACRCCRAAAAPRNAARPWPARSSSIAAGTWTGWSRSMSRAAARGSSRASCSTGSTARCGQHKLFFPVDVSTGEPRDDRRHDRQQQLRLALAALRQHGAQRARDRRAPRRRHAGVVRRGARQFRRRRRCPSAIATWSATCARLHRREADEIERALPARCCAGSAATTSTCIDDAGHNMAHLLVGSEGTLAFFNEIELDLQPIPAHRVLGICHFPSFYGAMEATRHIVELGPTAVELVDRTMIELARDIPMFRAGRRPLRPGRARGDPADRVRRRRPGGQSAPAEGARRADGRSRLSRRGRRGDRPGLPGGGVGGARAGPQHHDVDEGRREAGLLHRGLRGAARRPRRLHRAADPDLRQARHLRHLVRACLGRLPACAARCST